MANAKTKPEPIVFAVRIQLTPKINTLRKAAWEMIESIAYAATQRKSTLTLGEYLYADLKRITANSDEKGSLSAAYHNAPRDTFLRRYSLHDLVNLFREVFDSLPYVNTELIDAINFDLRTDSGYFAHMNASSGTLLANFVENMVKFLDEYAPKAQLQHEARQVKGMIRVLKRHGYVVTQGAPVKEPLMQFDKRAPAAKKVTKTKSTK